MYAEFVSRIENQYASTSELIDARYHLFYSDRIQKLSALELRALENVQLILLKPDAVASGKASQIVATLKKHGIFPIYTKFLQTVHERLFEELYRYNFNVLNPKSMIGSWWISKQGYQLAPSILMIVSRFDTDTAFTSPYEKLSSIKGPSVPYLGREGQLRYDFSAPSRPLNFIHSSDEPISTLREWEIFTSFDEIRAILDMFGHQLVGGISDLSMLNITESSLLADPPITDADYCAALKRVALRMASVLSEKSHIGRTAVEELYAMQIPALELRQRVSAMRDRFMSISKLLSLAELDSPRDKMLATHFLDLLRFTESNFEKISAALGAFEAAGLRVGEWDRLMLETNAHYIGDLAKAFTDDEELA